MGVRTELALNPGRFASPGHMYIQHSPLNVIPHIDAQLTVNQVTAQLTRPRNPRLSERINISKLVS